MDSAAAEDDFQIRQATPSDATDVAELLVALGYKATRKDAETRLKSLLSRSDGGVLLAETANNPVALASYQMIDLLERARPQCRVTALVTRQEYRRRGAATALIRAIESLARTRGCFRLEVTTEPERAAALDFYADLGFRERPLRLVKYLDAPSERPGAGTS